MATCHGAGACGTGTNATYDTACLLLATGDEQCASSTKTRRDPTSWSEGRNLVLAQGQEGGADEGRGQLRRLAREALEATAPTGASAHDASAKRPRTSDYEFAQVAPLSAPSPPSAPFALPWLAPAAAAPLPLALAAADDTIS